MTKTGKTKSVQVSDAGLRPGDGDGTAAKNDTARGRVTAHRGRDAGRHQARGESGAGAHDDGADRAGPWGSACHGGGGHPGETRGGWCGRRRDLAGKDRTADTCRAPDPAGKDRTAGAYLADQARTAVRARPRVASGFVGAPSAELGGRGCPAVRSPRG